MQINFSVGDVVVGFTRDPITGRAEAKTPNGSVILQDPRDLGTHFSLALKKEWRFSLNGADIVIEKKRPLLLAGFRAGRYRVFVNGQILTEQTGI